MQIVLRKLELNDENIIIDLKKEIEDSDNDFEGFSILKSMDNFDDFYKKIISNENPVDKAYSPVFVYLAFDNSELIGIVVLRTELKGNLVNYGGNVGYLVRPSKRKKGYGTLMLKEALKILKNEYKVDYVVLGCRVDNIGSAKVIEKNDATFVNTYYEANNGLTYSKYEKTIKK